MKKAILVLLAVMGVFRVMSQNINPENDYVPGKRTTEVKMYHPDSVASAWCLDGNLTAGFLFQDITTNSLLRGYSNSINGSAGTVSFDNGVSRGIDINVGYFFGCKRHYGIGLGLMYMYQQGDLTMDNFHVEYQSLDYFGNTFRQVLTANRRVKESISTSNLNIPVVFKYQRWFSNRVGFMADMGLLFNVLEKHEYTTDASFDYEAIYRYTGTQGNVVTVYDNSPTPDASDLLITRTTNMLSSSSNSADLQNYFNKLRADGYNVGLNVRPSHNKGSVYYNAPSVGILIRPAVSLWLNDYVALNLGLYYVYQNFTNDAPANYRITDQVGSYSSIANSVSRSVNNSFGINVGLRVNFHKKALAEPAPEPAPAPEPTAEEPPVASPMEEDDTEPEPVSLSTPILFEINEARIRSQSYPVLEEAVRQMQEHAKATLMIHGYTDITGTTSYNKALSKKRANAVKNYLHKKGVKSHSMKTFGHGAKYPAASNATSEGRARNRRVELKLKRR